MREIEKDGVLYLVFPSLEETGIVKHGFSTRIGGVSRGIYSSMNLSFQRGDEKEAVLENYSRLMRAMGMRTEDIVCSDQTHTTNIRIVTEEDRGKGVHRSKDYADIDGLLTDKPGIVLATFYADCVPLYFVDTEKHVIGLAHSGWRGTVSKMGLRMVERMTEEFGCIPQNIRTAIGPSICRKCYEISFDVAKEFQEAFKDEQLEKILEPKEDGKYQLDLWLANQMILLEAGIVPEHIEITDRCTCCNSEYLYSHRASKGKRGNLGAFIMLVPEAERK